MIHPTTLSVSDKTVEIRYLVTGRSSTAYTPTKYVYDRGAQIADTRSPGPLNFVLWLLISVGPQYGTCFVTLLAPRIFEVAPRFFEHLCAPG